MRLKKSAVAVMATASLLALAACGGSDSDSPDQVVPTQDAGGGAGAGKAPDMEGPRAVPDDAAEGGTVTVLTAVVPATLDPTRAYYTDSTAIMSMVTRALTQYVYDPETNDMVLAPDMATDLGQPNEDNTEWTFTLRDGLKYEDGTDVKPEDVAYAVSRSFAIEELPDGPTYQLQFFQDGDTYKGPFKDKAEYKGVTVDGNDITIHMSQPFPEMDYYASFPVFTGIPQAKDTKEEYGNHPLATGPYMFEDYKPGSSLTLVKNPNWDPATDPGRIQSVDKWVFKFGEDTAKLENTILSDTGEGQTTITYDNVTPPTYKKITADSPERLVVGTSPCTFMWFLDMRKITDINVRKAIGYAYPYVDVWKAGGEIVGLTRVPGTSILPPGTAGRVEYDVLGIKGQNTDPEKAKELLSGGRRGGLRARSSSTPPTTRCRLLRRTSWSRASRRVASPPPRSRRPWRRSARRVRTPTARSTSAPADGARTGRRVARGSRPSGTARLPTSRACRTRPCSSRRTPTPSRRRSSACRLTRFRTPGVSSTSSSRRPTTRPWSPVTPVPRSSVGPRSVACTTTRCAVCRRSRTCTSPTDRLRVID